jgi:hypothetical protein
MLLLQGLQVFRGEEGEDGLEPVVQLGVPAAVELEVGEEEEELLEVFDGEAVVDGPERMGEAVAEVISPEIGHQVMDIMPGLLDVPVLGFIEVINQDMGLAAILGEIGGDLFTEKGVGQAGDFETAVNVVVVGDGDPGHAPLFGDAVEGPGLGIAFLAAQFLENPLGRTRRVPGMDMQVDFHDFPLFMKCSGDED